MESQRKHPESRIYSTARVKRREKLNNQAIHIDTSLRDTVAIKSNDQEHKVHFIKPASINDSDSENVKPLARVRRKLAALPAHTSKLSSIKAPEYLSKATLLEKMSDSTTDSNDTSMNKITIAKNNINLNIEKEVKKIKILATLLPDEILRDPISRAPRYYQTALLFPDVSGFTQLCEKYDKTGMGGPSRLTEVLNGYLGSMINIILSKNGDVCKFGGDAILCSWKSTEETDISEVVHLAIESAVDIQKNCGEHKTDVGVKLRVKIAVAAGRALFSVIGTKARKHYVIVGPPVMDVRDAEQLGGPGDVIVTPSAWKHVKNYMYYSFTYHSDNKHIKIYDFGPLWKSAINIKTGNKNSLATSTRPFLRYVSRLNVEDLRPFVLLPVMKSIDLNRSLDYLTEMRQVAIVFFNVTADYRNLHPSDIVELSDRAIQIVSEDVHKNGGATNKLTLFDKDMAILCVFGLKGFKHELPSQVALKCAYHCLEQLKKLDVSSVSVGVTTGMTYCGVIGHSLRKEYTVMGHPVNLAARLMCAYQEIVSCDRNTFLYSKLESHYFELLNYEFLKGIQNAGPFYKFNLSLKPPKIKLDQEFTPLLGRAKEIEQFELFLKNGIKFENVVNFMVIYGRARIGKSRLAAKFIYIADKLQSEDMKPDNKSAVQVNRLRITFIPLSENDYKVTYATIRFIFQALLGLPDSSSKDERQDKILLKLGDIKELYLLAAFNIIFNVSFPLLPQYLKLSATEQTTVQLTVVKELYNKCFLKGEKWLVVIDDAEYIDEESWKLLPLLATDSRKALYLLTIGQKKNLSPVAVNSLDQLHAKKMILTEIDKRYYSALACQILEVKAIPVELENFLQHYKNSGNPGWMESFLLSLLQSGSIYIGQASTQKMKTLGLVAAPDFLLKASHQISENEKKDIAQWSDCLETFEKLSNDKCTMRACFLSSSFYLKNENEADLTMDVMLMKTIDTLKPLEQLVLKVGSVWGYNFKRAALEFVISKNFPLEQRPFAKAIKNLFELKVFTCAKGNFTLTNSITSKKMLSVTSIRKEVVCKCIGLVIPEECKDLPKYACCGYMQFRSFVFKDTVYNLLLDEQKRKFHYSCIEYLIENTSKCVICNQVPFTNVLGYKKNNEIELACTLTPMHGIRSTQLECKTNINALNNSNQHFSREKVESLDQETSPSVDTGVCQCLQILSSLYSILIEHALGSGKNDILLEVQLEYASISLTAYNIPLTVKILDEALNHVNKMKNNDEHPELCTPYIYAKIYVLIGSTKLSIGNYNEALQHFNMALKYLNSQIPTEKFSVQRVKILLKNEIAQLKLKMEFPKSFIGTVSKKKAPHTDLLSECLSFISVVYTYLENRLFAEYTSVRALNKALESNRNFFGLCNAYRTMIQVGHLNRNSKTCAKIEAYAINLCRNYNAETFECYEWEAICRLYLVICFTRHVRAEIEDSVLIGFQSIKIASVIRNTSLKLDLIPNLIFALIQLNRLSEAVALLQELEFMSQLDADKSSRLWYYSLCLDFHLYTGFTVVPYETCEDFVKEGDNISFVRDPDAKNRLYTSLWLWCVRNNEWELSKSYGRILENYKVIERPDIPCNLFTTLQKLEGFLITLVHKMDQRNIYTINATYTEIHSIMKRLEKEIKFVKVFKPRYHLLKSYYRQIRYRDDSYMRLLTRAYNQAEKMKDLNASLWIVHLKMVWSNAISVIHRDYWIEHSRQNNLEWHENTTQMAQIPQNQTILYSLPLPKF